MKIKILYFIFPILLLFSCFCSFGFMCNAQALPNEFVLDSNTYQVLYGSGGAGTSNIEFGINADPNLICYGVDQVINDVNTKLYDKFGWDLEDVAWKIEDQTKQNAINALKSGGTLPSGDYQLLSTLAPIGQGIGNWFNQYILGTVDALGNITNVLNKTITKVDSNLIDTMSDVRTDLIEDESIIDCTNYDGFMYGKKFKISFTQNSDIYIFYLNFSDNVFLASNNAADQYGTYDMFITVNTSQVPTLTGQCIVNGNTYNISSYNISQSFNDTFGSTVWQTGYLLINDNNYFNRQVKSNFVIGSLNKLRSYLGRFNDGQGAKAYGVDSNSKYYLESILSLLNGHWVTSDQIEQINRKIDGLTIGNIEINGDSNPVIDTDPNYLEELRQLIQSIIDSNTDLDNELGYDPDPNPNPNPNPDPIYNDQGISVFPDFPIPVLDNFTTILGMPVQFFSIFRPIFLIFGSYFNSLWSFWLFIPSCVVIGFIIWLVH